MINDVLDYSDAIIISVTRDWFYLLLTWLSLVLHFSVSHVFATVNAAPLPCPVICEEVCFHDNQLFLFIIVTWSLHRMKLWVVTNKMNDNSYWLMIYWFIIIYMYWRIIYLVFIYKTHLCTHGIPHRGIRDAKNKAYKIFTRSGKW